MGPTFFHLSVSLMSASRYGKFGRSANAGRRPIPITLSNSSLARWKTEGNKVMAKKNVPSAAVVLGIRGPA